MMLKRFLMGAVVALPLAAMGSQAQAVVVAGTSDGSFSTITGCGGDNCRINNTSNGTATQVEWGYGRFSAGSTLTAIDRSWSVNTNANDVTIAQLTWNNQSTSSSVTPDDFNVRYSLTIHFTLPSNSQDTEQFDISITNTNNPQGDILTGLTMADLSNLSFTLAGVTVSDLHFVLDSSGAGTFSNSVWRNPEESTSRLFLTADFTQNVPEPASLGLFAAGLIGLGGLVRRRRRD